MVSPFVVNVAAGSIGQRVCGSTAPALLRSYSQVVLNTVRWLGGQFIMDVDGVRLSRLVV